jgi:hypothetical protein
MKGALVINDGCSSYKCRAVELLMTEARVTDVGSSG